MALRQARLGHRALTTAMAALLLSAPAATAIGASPGDRLLRLEGELLVSPAENPDQSDLYAVRTDEGGLVAVSGDLGQDPRPGSRVRAQALLPSSIGTRTDEAALRIVTAQRTTLQVSSVSLTAPADAAAGTAATHHWYAAAPSNFGALGQSDTALLSQIAANATYWENQANGTIADIVPPTAIVRYSASATSVAAGCGLSGGDFWATVDEAAAQFPEANFSGPDQLLLLMPPGCSGVGRGGVGALSFGNGGMSISNTEAPYFQSTLAHELGHNYGYDHARMGPCGTVCASEYGDYYSVMGASVYGYNQPTALATPYRVMQGITDPGEVELLVGGEAPTTVTRTLQPRSGGSGLRSLALSDPDTGSLLYVDYRAGTGQDSGAYYRASSAATAFRSGVVVEEINDGTGIDLLPQGERKAMVAGDSMTLAGGSITVTVDSISGGAASVSVSLPGYAAWPNPGAVGLSTTPKVGATVAAELSGWTPTPSSVDHEWLLDGAPIPGATTATYLPTAGQAGHQLSVRITARTQGYRPAFATSPAKTVGPGTLTLTTQPVVTGTPQVGRTLICAPPQWSPPGGTVVTTTLWAADGTALPGTGPQLTVPAELVGKTLTCRVTVTRTGYTSASATSAPSTAILPGVLASATPTIRGIPRVGRTLTARPGAWTTGTTFRYQWYASGRPIPSATKTRLVLPSALKGQRIRVRVVGSLAGYPTVGRRSAPTPRVS